MQNLVLAFLTFIAFSGAHAAQVEAPENGTILGRNIFAVAYDYQGDPLSYQGNTLIYKEKPISRLVGDESKRILVSLFKHTIGGIYLSSFAEQKNGEEKLIDTLSMPLESVGGLSGPTGAQMSPWGTLIFSEAGLVDAASAKSFTETYKYYFKGKSDLVNPYNYGWLSELIILDNDVSSNSASISDDASAKVIKSYATGRTFASDVLIMPDNKSIYLLDAEHSGLLYLFVADAEGSLAEGTLYVVNYENGATRLVLLGARKALQVKFKLRKSNFANMLEKTKIRSGNCQAGFAKISTVYGKECVKVARKNRAYAGLFEPIRVAAMNGVTGLPGRLTGLRFNSTNNTIQVTRENAATLTLTLQENPSIHSNYSVSGEPL